MGKGGKSSTPEKFVEVQLDENVIEEGILYNGEWRDNICSGKGYWTDGKGNSYEGDWDNNLRHGNGIHVCANGYAYEGQWKNNVPEGRGIAVYPVSFGARLVVYCLRGSFSMARRLTLFMYVDFFFS